MFPRVSAFFAISIAVVTAARMERRIHVRRDSTASQCDTGDIRCCNSVANATDISDFLTQFSYPFNSADSVGIDCTPLNIYGAGEGAACQQQPVCCSNNNYSGYINVGCSPFDLN